MPFDPNATTFSAANALLLAEASEVAYKTEGEARTLMAARGLPKFKWIALNGVFKGLHAFTAANDEFAVLVFRGTADVADWMTDLNATPARYSWIFHDAPDAGEIHAGFGHALSDGWDDVIAAVREVSPSPALMDTDSIDARRTFWIAGHSLGGALAALAGSAFSLLPGAIRTISGIYTFGQPRIGLHDFCVNYDQLLETVTFRMVNNKDLVPRVPFRGWDYADVGEMIHFTSNGTPELQSQQWRSFLSRTLESFGEATQMFTHVRMDVGDHSMSNYRQLVADHQGPLDALFS